MRRLFVVLVAVVMVVSLVASCATGSRNTARHPSAGALSSGSGWAPARSVRDAAPYPVNDPSQLCPKCSELHERAACPAATLCPACIHWHERDGLCQECLDSACAPRDVHDVIRKCGEIQDMRR